MIAWWPGRIRAGTISDHISGFQDMMPTFAELAGRSHPPGIDGISMVQELLGRSDLQEKHGYLYWEFHAMGGRQAVRMDNWKAVRLNVRQNRNAPIELYNLEEDIAEQNDIANLHPDIVSRWIRLCMRHIFLQCCSRFLKIIDSHTQGSQGSRPSL
jgi:arylsulfatase A